MVVAYKFNTLRTTITWYSVKRLWSFHVFLWDQADAHFNTTACQLWNNGSWKIPPKLKSHLGFESGEEGTGETTLPNTLNLDCRTHFKQLLSVLCCWYIPTVLFHPQLLWLTLQFTQSEWKNKNREVRKNSRLYYQSSGRGCNWLKKLKVWAGKKHRCRDKHVHSRRQNKLDCQVFI